MNECPHCNTLNPVQASTCRVCNLDLPRKNQPSVRKTTSKMAVFDLDNTLFDLSRRERVARRQGLKPKSKKWFEFLNQNQYVLMDTAIPGTINFVRNLSENGYTIAYLSGRPRSVLAATKKSLQQAGFPIDALHEDLIFLHSGNPSKKNLIKHKLNVLTHLKSKFDVDFFFDDTPEFREAAKSLFIPGVYQSISAYTGNDNPRSNPMMSSASSTHAYEQPSRQNPHALVCPEHGIRASEEIGQNQFGSLICLECGADLKMDGNVRTNGAFDRLKKKVQNYLKDRELRKQGFEPVPDYVMPESAFSTYPGGFATREEYLADLERQGEIAKRARQRKLDNIPPREKRINEFNRGSASGLEDDLGSLENLIAWGDLMEEGFSSKEAEDIVYGPGGMRYDPKPKSNPQIQRPRQLSGSTAARCRRCGTQLGTVEARRRGCPNCAISNPPPKPRKKRGKSGKMRKEPVKKYVERFMGDKKMNEEFPDRAQRFAVGLSYAREFYGNSTVERHYPSRDIVRTNPGTVAEAKEMYKKFHQKNPSSVKKQKIDIGDTWVGLGKAWSIGYRSGKETGDSKQKYIHNFGVDEESGKKFKEPDLYYVKNKDGSQMMVIMGGDWYIDVDSDGKVSWIYI